MIPAFYTQRQLARVESTGVATENGNVVYRFKNHPYINTSYNGIVIVRLSALPTGATTEPVVFNSGEGNKNVTLRGGGNMTAASITGAGIYLFYFDSATGVIQFIS